MHYFSLCFKFSCHDTPTVSLRPFWNIPSAVIWEIWHVVMYPTRDDNKPPPGPVVLSKISLASSLEMAAGYWSHSCSVLRRLCIYYAWICIYKHPRVPLALAVTEESGFVLWTHTDVFRPAKLCVVRSPRWGQRVTSRVWCESDSSWLSEMTGTCHTPLTAVLLLLSWGMSGCQ